MRKHIGDNYIIIVFQNYFFLNQIIVVVVLIQCYSININKLNELEYVGAILKKMAIFKNENALRLNYFLKMKC